MQADNIPSSPDPLATPADPVPPARPISPTTGWVVPIALAAGLLGALAGWGLGETGLSNVQAREELVDVMGAKLRMVTHASRDAADLAIAMRVFGVAGAALGLALGLAGGLSRRSGRQALIAGAIGLLAGGVAPVIALRLALPIYQIHASGTDLLASLSMHAAVWVPIGAAAGLALGVGRGGRAQALHGLLGGAVGGLVGTFLFEFIGALAMPEAETGMPIALTWGGRLMTHLTVAAAVAILAARAVRRPAAAA